MRPKSFSQKKRIFKNDYLDLYSVIADFGSFSREYFVTKKGTRAGVILEKDDSILLVKQYRYVINDYSWEIPSGGLKEGESLEDAAIRECLEETGMKCRTLKPVFDFVSGVDVADSHSYVYSCEDFYTDRDFDGREITEIRWVPHQKYLEMIISKEIRDIFTIIGLLVFNNK